jgi:hypothetical protein
MCTWRVHSEGWREGGYRADLFLHKQNAISASSFPFSPNLLVGMSSFISASPPFTGSREGGGEGGQIERKAPLQELRWCCLSPPPHTYTLTCTLEEIPTILLPPFVAMPSTAFLLLSSCLILGLPVPSTNHSESHNKKKNQKDTSNDRERRAPCSATVAVVPSRHLVSVCEVAFLFLPFLPFLSRMCSSCRSS